VNHLAKIKYLYFVDCSRGTDIRISKLGYERWNKLA
jgi:hypothetical protein